MFFIITGIVGVLLFIASAMDLKSKTVSRGLLLMLIMVCLTGALFRVFMNNGFGLWDITGGAFLGLCAIGLSLACREQIGRGDGLVIVAIGLILGFRKCLFAVCAASIIMTLVSVIILILRKGNRNTRLPFIPALFVGYVMCMAVIG